MKLFTTLLLALSLSAFAACGDDDGGTNNPDAAPNPTFDAAPTGDDGCGNQLLLNNGYGDLAAVFADDVLIVDTNGTACGYLGVELATTDACGGRLLTDDVIDASYGALSGAAGASDGVAADVTPEAAFPYIPKPAP